MGENKNYLLKGAMAYGMSLGIFWVIKYIFFILSIKIPFLGVIYWGMSMVVPYLAYLLTKKYKQLIGGKISFYHAWQFGILIYFFAALIVSLVHFVFYQYIAPANFIETSYQQTIELLKSANIDQASIEAFRALEKPTAIDMTIQGIFNNILYGIILSIPVAAIVCRGYNSGSTQQKNIDNTIE